MSIATEITALTADRNDIRTALVNKGVSAASAHGFDDFAGDITNMPSGTATIVVSPVSGKTITSCTVTNPRGTVISGTQVGSVWTYSGLDIFGTYQIVATNGTSTASVDQLVDMVGTYPITITYTRLPDGYTEVEYIQSTGTQYILTNLFPTQDYSVSFYQTGKSGAFFFGEDSGWRNKGFGVAPPYCEYGTSGTTGTYYSGHKDGFFEFIKGVIKYDGVTVYTNTQNNFTAVQKLAIFANNRSGTIEEKSSYKLIGDFIVYNNNDVVGDFVPCIRNSDSSVGMYDLVSNTFFGNSGTGVFVAGNPV